MEKEIVELLIISKEDFRNYFNSRKIIDRREYEEYVLKKSSNKNLKKLLQSNIINANI
jgi:hypothetical protein